MKVRASIEFEGGIYMGPDPPSPSDKGAYVHLNDQSKQVVSLPLYIDGARVGDTVGLPRLSFDELRTMGNDVHRENTTTVIDCELELPLHDSFDGLMVAARELLDRAYPNGTVACSADSPDPGPRLAAALRECLEALGRGK